VLSFLTQIGRVYQVWSKDSLTDPTWSLSATLSGNGSVKSWSEAATRAQRFTTGDRVNGGGSSAAGAERNDK
jgi:hypothetical protein